MGEWPEDGRVEDALRIREVRFLALGESVEKSGAESIAAAGTMTEQNCWYRLFSKTDFRCGRLFLQFWETGWCKAKERRRSCGNL